MDGTIYFVGEPFEAELDGGNVRVVVRSGQHEWVFETPISVFIASFAVSAEVVHASHERQCEVVELGAVGRH